MSAAKWYTEALAAATTDEARQKVALAKDLYQAKVIKSAHIRSCLTCITHLMGAEDDNLSATACERGRIVQEQIDACDAVKSLRAFR